MKPKARGNKVIAVGTTATRATESAAQANGGELKGWTGDTQIFIYPGYAVQSGGSFNYQLPFT